MYKYINYEYSLYSDNYELHFGFQRSLGCPLITVVDFLTSRGSQVFAAALDISKTFDNGLSFTTF